GLWSGGERGGSLPFTLALARGTAPACTLVARCEDPAKEVATLVLAVPRYPPPPLRPSRLTNNLKLSNKTTLCAVFRRCSRATGLPLALPFFPPPQPARPSCMTRPGVRQRHAPSFSWCSPARARSK
ncbi:unnamed protein product, partial [Laminaria digitata]